MTLAPSVEQLELALSVRHYSARPLRLRMLAAAVASEPLPLGEAWRFVADTSSHDLTPGSKSRFVKVWGNFERYARAVVRVEDAAGVQPELVARFINARTSMGRPAPSTMSVRLSAVRYLYASLRQLGLVESDPTLDIRVDRTAHHRVRTLTDAEVDRCRWAAEAAIDAAARYAAIWALLEAGASTGETGMARRDQVADDGRSVRLVQEDGARERLVTATAWGTAALTRGRAEAGSDWIAVLRAGTYDSQRTSVTHVVREILARAGIHGAEPRSITAWVARRAFDTTGSIEAAARAIGFASLDRTAALIGHNWHPESTG